MSEYSSDYSYAAAKSMRGRQLELDGPTYEVKEWIRALPGARWDKAAKRWRVALPTNNRDLSGLLYQLAQRGLRWRALP